ncbi:hypothetical protein RJT34_18946 [Clitoria ternatea]|uniref:Glycine-rich protein n=1 Tax=Clitoria ternatea TaxID=43366 RepID=A0AAN9IQB8_CLITE
MAKWCFLLLVLSLAVATSARNVPSDNAAAAAGLNDQKNFVSFGGVGGYSGIGSNGLPFGGAGAGVGGGFGGGLGGGGLGGLGGIGGVGGLGGTGGGVGGGIGSGIGGGNGVLPYP